MTKVIVIGHGGYSSGIRRNINMLVGEQQDYYYIDFNETDDLEILREKIRKKLLRIGENDVLFCCDMAGGTPFREAATICLERPGCCCVAGLNTVAYVEMTFQLSLPPAMLANLAIDTAKQSILQFIPTETEQKEGKFVK